MKKLIIAALAFTVSLVVVSADTVFTNQMGQTFTIEDPVVGGAASGSGITTSATAANYVTYDLAKVAALTVASNDDDDTITAENTYLSSAAAATNVTFAASYPAGKDFKFINVGTNSITIVTSAGFDVGASNLVLGPTDVLSMHAISISQAVRVSNADN